MIIGRQYQVGKKIGQGSFGVIFEGKNILNGQKIALKFESKKNKTLQLRKEYNAYHLLTGVKGVPKTYYYREEERYNILGLELLGPSLETVFEKNDRVFSLDMIVDFGKQMIRILQRIHEQEFMYRDVKPDNFLTGRKNDSDRKEIYIVDLGMVERYRNPISGKHIPFKKKKSMSGTARYMSINTHLGYEQSRRDDLEGLGYIFLYFLLGSLPWQGLKASTNKQKYNKIGAKKQSISIDELCRGYPVQFFQYLTYSRNLGFEDTPDYNFLVNLLEEVSKSFDKSKNLSIQLLYCIEGKKDTFNVEHNVDPNDFDTFISSENQMLIKNKSLNECKNKFKNEFLDNDNKIYYNTFKKNSPYDESLNDEQKNPNDHSMSGHDFYKLNIPYDIKRIKKINSKREDSKNIEKKSKFDTLKKTCLNFFYCRN